MSTWDLQLTHEHLEDLYSEAQAIRLTRALHPDRLSLFGWLLLKASDYLIDCGVWLKSRYQKTNGRPHRFVLLDLGTLK